MFLRQLSSLSSSFLPQSHPALLRASSSPLLPLGPAPPPWWSVWGFPPWPQTRPLSGRTVANQNPLPAAAAAAGWRSFHMSGGLMERRDGDTGPPPHKWRKSAEEKRSVEERGGPGRTGGEATGGGDPRREKRSVEERGGPGGRGGEATGGGDPRREHRRLDPAGGPEPKHRSKPGSHDRWKTRDGEEGRRENSRGRDGDGGRSAPKEPQPARTQTSQPKPPGQNPGPKTDPWSRDRLREEHGGRGKNGGGARNPWLIAGAGRPPPPTGPAPPPGSAPLPPARRKFGHKLSF